MGGLAVVAGFVIFYLWIRFGQTVLFLLRLVHALIKVKIHALSTHGKCFSYADVFEDRVDANPDLVQFVTVEDEKVWTLAHLEKQANQLAHWTVSKGYHHGDTIAVMMLNSPSMVSLMIGFAKTGVATALLNTNAAGKTFVHVVEVATRDSENKTVIVDTDLKEQITGDLPALQKLGVQVVFWSNDGDFLKPFPTHRPDRSLRADVRENDPLAYIFTSGTTGLPKSSKISHSRFFIGGLPFSTLAVLKPTDRVYNTLPLYHSAGMMIGVGACIYSGTTIVLRRKFSVRNFASDCVKFNCNVIQYIGELCRYLLNAPVSPDEAKLHIDYAFGNGMMADVWEKFQPRFHIKHVIELYGATEGNCNLFNGCDVVGSCGYIPRVLDFLYPLAIVVPDPDNTDLPLRDPKTGLCVQCKPGEPGLLVGLIKTNDTTRRFEGYTDANATKKKVLCDVVKKGDTWFNSGDLLRRDYWGWYYWCDRTGDTFRWKGENVATTEVEHVLQGCPEVSDVAVYGVKVPDQDGRAGMAALVLGPDTTVDKALVSIAAEVSKNLPAYSRPLFLRFDSELMMTGTFKHQKAGLVADGFDPSLVLSSSTNSSSTTHAATHLYYYKVKDNWFELITADVFSKINAGKM